MSGFFDTKFLLYVSLSEAGLTFRYFSNSKFILGLQHPNSPSHSPTSISYLILSGSHGKDNKLIVWKLSEEDETSMSVVLPVDTPSEPRKQPWVLHILHVNTMNFCSFAQADGKATSTSESEPENELLIAVPNTMSSETVISLYLSPAL